jgi:NAD(P)H dehydrogenase (quinone)
MARLLVTYCTRTGHTAAMAEHVAAGAREVEGTEVDLVEVAEVDPKGLDAYDGLLVGSPTYYGLLAAEIKALFDASVAIHGRLEGKVGGAFTSAANLAGGNETTLLSILQAMLVHGMVVKGTAQRDHYGPVAIGAPDQRAEEECHKLGRTVAELAAKLHG